MNGEITVIVNIWKRDHIEEQLQALLRQSVEVKEIWILHYCDHVPMLNLSRLDERIHYIKTTINFKYYGRFSIALHSTTRFTWVLDDDIVPSPEWAQKCIATCLEFNAIVTSNGRLIPKPLPSKTFSFSVKVIDFGRVGIFFL